MHFRAMNERPATFIGKPVNFRCPDVAVFGFLAALRLHRIVNSEDGAKQLPVDQVFASPHKNLVTDDTRVAEPNVVWIFGFTWIALARAAFPSGSNNRRGQW